MCRFVTLGMLVATGLTTACATGGASGRPVPHPFPRPGVAGPSSPGGTAAPPTMAAPADGYGIAGTALSLRGVPYAQGGSDVSGFDCSGLVWYVFAQHGIAIPRTVADQYRAGRDIAIDKLEPGDLVFFDTKGAGATHVGIVIGGDEFVHAPSSQGAVRVERLGTRYWSPRFVGARRLLPLRAQDARWGPQVMPRDAGPCASTAARSCQ